MVDHLFVLTAATLGGKPGRSLLLLMGVTTGGRIHCLTCRPTRLLKSDECLGLLVRGIKGIKIENQGQIKSMCRPLRVVLKQIDVSVQCQNLQESSAAKDLSVLQLS